MPEVPSLPARDDFVLPPRPVEMPRPDDPRHLEEQVSSASTVRDCIGFTGILHIDRPGNEGRAASLSDRQKLRLVTALDRLLASAPTTDDEHVAWHRCHRTLQLVDARGETARRFDAVAIRHVERYMRDLDDRLRAEQARLGELPDASDRRRQLGRLFDQHLQRLLLLMQALATEGGRVVCGAAMQRAQEAMVRAVEPRLQVNMLLRDAARRIAIDGADERIWTMLDRLIAAGRIRDERLRRTPDGATYRFAHEGGERIWIIESINVGGDGLVRIRRGDRPEIFVGVEPGTFFEMAAAGRIGDLCRQAVSNHERQRQPERLALRAYDFPVERLRRTGGKIAHIRLFSADREVMGSVITSMIQASALRGAALRARYGEDMVLLPPPAIDRDPIQALRRALRGAYDLGARHFPVDVFSHGTSEYLDMGRRVTGAQLLEVLRELPNDASFDLSTIACFGGGLRVSLMRALARPENASIRGRLNVFLEAKPYVGNILMTVGGDALERERNGTHQYYLVTRSLFAGRSYGQAHEYADDMTPDFLPMDPEVILRGVLLTRRDATPDAHLA